MRQSINPSQATANWTESFLRLPPLLEVAVALRAVPAQLTGTGEGLAWRPNRTSISDVNSVTQNVKVWLISLTVVVVAGLLNGAIGVTVFNRVLQGETASHSLGLRMCAVLVQVLGVAVGSMILSRLTRGSPRGGDILLQTFFAVMAGQLLFITRGAMLALFWKRGVVFVDFFKLRDAAVLIMFALGITAICVAARYLLPLFRPESRTVAK